MAKQSVRAEINSFIKGLITEASPLNFPPDASLDEQNFEANRSGIRERRLGMDFEDDFSLIDLEISPEVLSTLAFSSFYWESAGGEAENKFIVVQIGNLLKVFDSTAPSISLNGFKGDIPLTTLSTTVKVSFTAVDGNLIVASGEDFVTVIKYNADTEVFTTEIGRLKVRDLWGVEVVGSQYETDVKYRAATAPTEHIYNLRNQSWAIPRRGQGSGSQNPIDILDYYFDRLGVYPSNSEVVWSGMTFRGDVSPPAEIFASNIIRETLGADNLAPKGHFIIDLLRRGESRLEAVTANQSTFPELVYPVTSLKEDRTVGGPKVVAEYAGRVWFGGFGGRVVDGDARSPDLSSYVAFSQLVNNTQDIFKCYQEGDPSSRDTSDLVDTDGGYIRISGAYGIQYMASLGKELIVLSTNGVWSVMGTDNSGFTATSYQSKKLSSFGCISASSVVLEGDNLFYWSEDGINVITRNQYGDLVVQNITQETIQTFFERITSDQKVDVIASYDPFDRRIRWLFRLDEKTIELVFDLSLTAFFINRIFDIEGEHIKIISMVRGEQISRGQLTVDVVLGGDPVEVGVDQVQITLGDIRTGVQASRYITIVKDISTSYLTFSLYKNAQFRDWFSFDNQGIDAKAFLLTGSVTGGDSALHKQMPYLIMHFIRTEEGVFENEPINQSSCLVRTQWDWANSSNSGKWQPFFQAYRYRRPYFISGPSDPYDNGLETTVTKNKIRGRGRAFSVYMETEEFKDCRIIGWVLDVNGNQKV